MRKRRREGGREGGERERERERACIHQFNQFLMYLYITSCIRIQNLSFFFQYGEKKMNFKRENAISLATKNGSV